MGYGAETATVDALIMQTSSQRLQQKAIQENPKYSEMVDLGISMEQAKKKAESMPDGEGTETTRALAEEVRQLKQKLEKKETIRDACKSCMLPRCKGGEKCPAKNKNATDAKAQDTSLEVLYVLRRVKARIIADTVGFLRSGQSCHGGTDRRGRQQDRGQVGDGRTRILEFQGDIQALNRYGGEEDNY